MTESPTALASTARPRYDGANIRTWIGFRQFLALAEEAVLGWFRQTGHGPHRLFHQHGLELTIVDCSAVLPAVLEVDDEVTADVTPLTRGRFRVALTALRDGDRVAVLNGRVTVALVDPADRGTLPEELAWHLDQSHRAVGDALGAQRDSPMLPPPVTGHPMLRWTWRARYFYCHFSDRVQHSAYVRALEEVVDRYLADRGLSVGRLLKERGWIPVVSRVRIRLLADAHMEEDVHTTFSVTDVLKDVVWEGRMDCHVHRDSTPVWVATASIQHGYAVSRGRDAGRLAVLDPVTVAVLTGRQA
jgi:acyl-CoA thioesterase FadM